ncbi:atp3 gamma subunit of the F1 sector of mitochondrial F1F0 ATP synthase, partial [Quaeritorhiza haematococci]
MATLKEIQLRLRSIQNIAKITKSMKMIASTKMTKAQKAMDTARTYGQSAKAAYDQTATTSTFEKPIAVAVSSDRGLCGAIHSSVSKGVKKYVKEVPAASIVVLGQKAKPQIAREAKDNIALSFEQVAKNGPTWYEASMIADNVLSEGPKYDAAKIFYNRFKSVIAFETSTLPVYSAEAFLAAPKLSAYEIDDTEVIKNFTEFTFANVLYWAIAEGHASEMAAKRTAMENATKNAGEMIQKLTMTYNRSRQAAITNEL